VEAVDLIERRGVVQRGSSTGIHSGISRFALPHLQARVRILINIGCVKLIVTLHPGVLFKGSEIKLNALCTFETEPTRSMPLPPGVHATTLLRFDHEMPASKSRPGLASTKYSAALPPFLVRESMLQALPVLLLSSLRTSTST